MSQSYHQQFRENQRNKKQNDIPSNSKATAGSKLSTQRPNGAAKQPLRSETFTLPSKRDERTFIVPKPNQPENGSRQQSIKKPTVMDSTLPAIKTRKPAASNTTVTIERKPIETMRKQTSMRSSLKQSNVVVDRENYGRRPVRFANDYNDNINHHNNNNNYHNNNNNNNYYPPTPPSLSNQRPASYIDPRPRDTFERPRRVRVVNDEYATQYPKDSSTYAYSDYHTVSEIPTIPYTTSLPSITRVVKESGPTVIIRPKEPQYSEAPTNIPTISISPSYIPPPVPPPPPPPSSTAPIMLLPAPNMPPFPPMNFPLATAPGQPLPGQAFLIPLQTNPTFAPPPFLFPMPNPGPQFPSSAPPPPLPPPPPPVQNQTSISQSSTCCVSAPPYIKTENKVDDKNTTLIVHPHSNDQKNVTIQVKMMNEDNTPVKTKSQRVVRVMHEPPYREIDDRYYIESEPKQVIYEEPVVRRTLLRRPPPPAEYVYVDEVPSNVVRRRARRPEVVYVDEDDTPVEYEEEVVYVDKNGNEIEYIYDDEPSYHPRHYRRYHQPVATNIVYE